METHWGLHDAPPSPPPVAGALAPVPLAHPVSSGRRHHHQPSSDALARATSAAAARAGAISSAAALAGATSSAAALLGSTSSAAAATIPPPSSSISATVELLPTRLQEGGLPLAGKRKSPEGDVSSVAKRKVPGVKRKKRPPTNRKPPQGQLTDQNSPAISVVVRSPIAPAIVRSPGLRILLSTAAARSPNQTSHQEPVSNSHGLPRRSKRRKLKSDIWEDFDPIYDAQDILVEAKCKHCCTVFNATRGYGTSSCRRHLENCDGKNRIDQMLAQLKSDSLSNDESLKDWTFKQKVARQELVNLIVMHELPFSLVEYPKFRTFCASLNPWFTHVSRTTIRSDCISAYEHQKEVLRETLKNSRSRVSLTADFWTSNQNLGYLCVTCHFIDDSWNIHKRIIKFTSVETPHDGRTMFNALLRSVQDWNIEDKVFSITLDNATVNDSFAKSFKENLVAKGLLLRKGKLLHCRCAAHVLNLIVQDGFNAISSATRNIRDSVKYVKSSPSRKQRFEEMVKQVGIPLEKRPPLDVVTRWNSTYDMLMVALRYKTAFEALDREDPQYIHEPTADEWKMADKLCGMLEVFSEATKVLSGSKYPTMSCYFHQLWEVKRMLQRESANPDMVIKTMIQDMKAKFQKYWDLSYLKICIPVFLDPRFKLSFLEFRLTKGFEGGDRYFSKVEKYVRKLFAEYSSRVVRPAIENIDAVNNEDRNGAETNPWADWGQHQRSQQLRKISELDRYLEEELMPVDVELDILQHWKMHSTRYPILSCMARDLLAVPASSVASESAFSTGERVISDYRSRLTSETVEALICLQDWIRENDTNHDHIAGNTIGDDEDNI